MKKKKPKDLRTQDEMQADLNAFTQEAMRHGQHTLKVAGVVLGKFTDWAEWARSYRLHFALSGRALLLQRMLVRLGYDNARLDALLRDEMAALEQAITDEIKVIVEQAQKSAEQPANTPTDPNPVRRMMRLVRGGMS